MKPSHSEFNPYFKQYIDLVPTENLLLELEENHIKTQKILASIGEELGDYKYEEGKWTIKDLFVHLMDCERIFNYRALCLSRGEKQELPGFDENEYALNVDTSKMKIADIAKEFQLVRNLTIALYRNFDEKALSNKGVVGGGKLNVNAIGYIICGHELHHINVLQEKYLKSKEVVL